MRLFTRTLALASATSVLSVTSLAQTPANDLCVNATPITGTGLFQYDNSLAMTDGIDDGMCFDGQTAIIDNDIFFAWTAPSTDMYTIETCGVALGQDSKLSVLDGSCTGVAIACNDDGCPNGSIESHVEVPVVANNLYIIRVGNFAGGIGGVGRVRIEVGGSLPAIIETHVNPANSHTYHVLETASWPLSQHTAETLGGNLVTVNDQPEHDWLRDNLFNFSGASPRDLWLGLNDRALEGTFVWADGTPVGYTNWNMNEPSNAAPEEDFVHMQKNFMDGGWNDIWGPSPDSAFFHSQIFGVVEIGANFPSFCVGDGGNQMGCTDCPCGNNQVAGSPGGCLNSANTGAVLLPSGSPSVTMDTLRMELTGGVPTSFGVLTSGGAQAPANMGNPCFGQNSGIQSVNLDGLRCAVQGVLRHGSRPIDANGESGVTTPGWGPPNGPPQGLAAQGGFVSGQTRYYQVIYREVPGMVCGTEQNTSQGVEVGFLP